MGEREGEIKKPKKERKKRNELQPRFKILKTFLGLGVDFFKMQVKTKFGTWNFYIFIFKGVEGRGWTGPGIFL